VRAQGRSVSKLVRSAIELHDWLSVKSKLKPERMSLVLNDLNVIYAEIGSAFGDEMAGMLV
jgi:hypothetical protein